MFKKTVPLVLSLALPFTAFAAWVPTDVFTVEVLVYGIIVDLSRLFWAIAIAFFVWGIIKFITNAEDSAEREKGKQYIVWALIALVILISIWGIAQLILVDTLGIVSFGAPDFIDKNGLPVPV